MRVALTMVLTLAVLMAGCTPFEDIFQRVDTDRVRVLDFMYEPAEAAPGDTVTLVAVFAGRPVSAGDIDWSVSYNVKVNFYGLDTALDIHPLPPESSWVDDTAWSPNTHAVSVRFVVPDSIMYWSSMIPENVLELVPANIRGQIPDLGVPMEKGALLGMMDSLAVFARIVDSIRQVDSTAAAAFLSIAGTSIDSLSAVIAPLLQILTVRMRFFAEIEGSPGIQSSYTVRYTSLFAGIPGFRAYVNANPLIDSVGVYKVKGEGLLSFDPAVSSQPYEFIRLRGAELAETSVVEIDKGYTYFAATFPGRADSAASIDAVLAGRPADTTEDQLATYWFAQDSAQEAGVSVFNLMNVGNGVVGTPIQSLYPPRDRRATQFVMWVQVSDSYLGELYRPSGSTLGEVIGRFEFTDAYLDALKE